MSTKIPEKGLTQSLFMSTSAALEFRDFLEDIHQMKNIPPGLPVRIGPVFLLPPNPDLEINGIRLFDLIYPPVLDFQDQQALLFAEKNEIRFPALFPNGRLIPADKFLIRPGRIPEKSKNLPS